ncbi:MAG: TonB-dependent receptor [Gammaproteobacteria bacterium]|nr:TonB-dependent receptor [Gammaproteobacteria bacterium]
MITRRIIATAVLLPLVALANDEGTIEEILVTVQKREQSLRDVPVAVSAFSGEFMDSLSVRDFRDVVTLTPGFNGATADSFNDALAIRGISTNNFGVGGDGAVPVFVDGVYEGRNGGAITSFLDVARTEIVRGPQNTLFGRNAIGGAVSIITNKPDPEAVSGNFGFGIEEYEHWELDGTINLPINDRWAFRGSFGFVTEDGYLTNLAGGKDLGEFESTAVQAAIRYAGDSVDATLSAFYEERDGDGSAYWSTAPLNSSGEFDLTNTAPLPENAVVNEQRPRDSADILRLALNIDVDLPGGLTLNSITGFKTYDFNYVEDYDATSRLVNSYTQDQEVDYFSQELRLVSADGDRFTWFVGASVYAEDVKADFADRYTEDELCRALQVTDAPDFDLSARVTGCDDPIFEDYWEDDIDPADLLVDKPEETFADGEYWGWAIYGDVNWRIGRLDLTVGARYTFDEKEYTACVLDSGGALGNNLIYSFFWTADERAACSQRSTGAAPGGFVSDKRDWDRVTPRFAVNFDVTDEWTLYGNIASGYKSGGFSDFAFVDVNGQPVDEIGLAEAGTRPQPVEKETSLSYEGGVKSRLFGNTLQANLAMFGYEYEDLQITFFETGAQRTDTLDEASGYGVELDLQWVPGENWDIFFSVAYSKTEVDKVKEDFGGCDACEGNELPFAPRWTTGTVVTYSFPLNNGASIYATGVHTFHDEMFGGLDNLELAKTDSWNRVDLRIGYDSGTTWSITAYVWNVGDETWFERGWENADSDNLFGYGNVNTRVWPSKPRTFGARFDYRFGGN